MKHLSIGVVLAAAGLGIATPAMAQDPAPRTGIKAGDVLETFEVEMRERTL